MIIGMLIFPDMTQLDFAGPHEVFTRMPGCEVKVIAKSLQAVTEERRKRASQQAGRLEQARRAARLYCE